MVLKWDLNFLYDCDRWMSGPRGPGPRNAQIRYNRKSLGIILHFFVGYTYSHLPSGIPNYRILDVEHLKYN